MTFVQIGAVLAFLAVAAGAFGAHGLRSVLSAERLEVFEVAVRYQMYHALALIAAGILDAPRAGSAFLFGTIVFSGSLYLLVLTDKRWLGAITPIGGALFLLGWVLLALDARR